MRKTIPPSRSRQNGIFHFVKTNRLYENGFIPLRWDLTSTQLRSHLGGMIFLHVNSFCRTFPPIQDSFSTAVAISYYCKLSISLSVFHFLTGSIDLVLLTGVKDLNFRLLRFLRKKRKMGAVTSSHYQIDVMKTLFHYFK